MLAIAVDWRGIYPLLCVSHVVLCCANFPPTKCLLTLFDDRTKAIDDCDGQHDGYQEEYVEYNERSHETGMWFFLAISTASAHRE